MKVQCLIPKYNNGRYIEAAIKSILNQKYPFHSILVCENHSKDGSANFIKELAFKDNRIKFFIPQKFAPSFGHSVAELIEHIDLDTDYVHIASSDDIWDKLFLQKLVNFIDKNNKNNLSAIFCDRILIDENSKCLGATGNLRIPSVIYNTDYNGFKYFSKGCSYIISGALFKTDVVKNLASLARKTNSSFDWILMLEASRLGSIGYFSEPLFQYRLHENNTNKIAPKHVEYLNAYADMLSIIDPIAFDIIKIKTKNNDSENDSVLGNNFKNKKLIMLSWCKFILHKTKLLNIARLILFNSN